jgi:uncharacterized protein (TIGR02646 family)
MIQMQHRELPAEALAELASLQMEITRCPSHLEQVKAAVSLWKNRRHRKVFDLVEKELGAMCPGPKRCMFCEDNGAHQIEHFRPKSLYPGLVYAWSNYLFACGQCNTSKGDRFAIFSSSGVAIALEQTNTPPADGNSVLLDPRQDEPMDYLWLDLRDTFLFEPIHAKGTPAHSRADYTLGWLGLNDRDELLTARRTAYEHYLLRLKDYIFQKRSQATADTLNRLRRSIERLAHTTVWREMQRQHLQIEELRPLFEEAPEALLWK